MPHGNVEFADFLACAAFRAFFRVDFEAVKRDFVENAVNRSERADIATERAVDYNRRNEHDGENRYFPAEDEACRPAHGRIQKHERNSAFKSADRANPLAEPRLAQAGEIRHERRKQNHEHGEEDEAEPAQGFFTRQAADFFDERDFIQQILNQPERTEKAADKSAEQRSENHEKTHDIHRNAILACVERRLQ